MSLRARFCPLFEGVIRRGRMESNMEDELRFRRERYAADLVAPARRPATPNSRRAANSAPSSRSKEECRQAHGLRLLDETAQDLRYTLRTFRKNPPAKSSIATAR